MKPTKEELGLIKYLKKKDKFVSVYTMAKEYILPMCKKLISKGKVETDGFGGYTSVGTNANTMDRHPYTAQKEREK